MAVIAPYELAALAVPSTSERTLDPRTLSFLGCGLLVPFQRDEKRDFANGCGLAVIRSSVHTILTTMAQSEISEGELPWRTEFGSVLYLLRHRNNDIALAELARVHISDALERWEPRIQLTNVAVSREEQSPGTGQNVMRLAVTYNVLATNAPTNQVVIRDITQLIPVTTST